MKWRSERVIKKYYIETDAIKLEVLNLGGVIYRCETRNKFGEFENIVVSFKDITEFEKNDGPNFGALIGRISGRIRNGRFTLNQQQYKLPQNNGKHHLHGGHGYAFRYWDIEQINGTELQLTLTDKAGDQGFPGTVVNKVTYKLLDNRLEITYQATSDEDTLWDMTQHTYWNLSGGLKDTVVGHELKINADYYGTLDKDGMVTDKVVDVTDTIFDVRQPVEIKEITTSTDEQIQYGMNGFDHPFVLNDNQESAFLFDKKSGRKLTVITDKPALVCYMGTQLSDEYFLLENRKTEKYLGICLETQYLPNSINVEGRIEVPILYKNKPVTTKTIFVFDVEKK